MVVSKQKTATIPYFIAAITTASSISPIIVRLYDYHNSVHSLHRIARGILNFSLANVKNLNPLDIPASQLLIVWIEKQSKSSYLKQKTRKEKNMKYVRSDAGRRGEDAGRRGIGMKEVGVMNDSAIIIWVQILV